MDRRDFLKSLASLTAGILMPSLGHSQREGVSRDRLGELLPTRILGRTGQTVTMLGVGGWHIGRMSETEAQATIETALEGGVRFFDAAESYQNGGSESRLGRLLTPRYRDVVYLMTKTMAPDGATARRHLEESLRRLRTDYLDLWQVHALLSPRDVDGRIERGVLQVVEEAKASGKTRHIGFTGHSQVAAHQRMLQRTDLFDCCQMPVSLADACYESFIKGVLPTLVERKIGVLAMKTLANGGFFGGNRMGEAGPNPRLVPDRVSVAQALHFVWSLPVSVLITGPNGVAQMKEKIELARSFRALDEAERQRLIEQVADLAGPRVEFYKG